MGVDDLAEVEKHAERRDHVLDRLEQHLEKRADGRGNVVDHLDDGLEDVLDAIDDHADADHHLIGNGDDDVRDFGVDTFQPVPEVGEDVAADQPFPQSVT